MPRVPLLLSVLFVTAASCIPNLPDDLSTIRTPRILAVRSVPAEARPGGSVQLTALVAAPPPFAAPAEQLEWALCTTRKPLTELGPVAQECIDGFAGAREDFVRLGRAATVSATVPQDACRRFGPAAPPAEAGGAAARPVDPDRTGGYYQPVIVGGDVGTALASVRIACGLAGVPNAESVRFTQGYRPNENPAIDRLEIVSGTGVREITKSGAHVPRSARLELRVTWAVCPRAASCGDGLCTSGENQASCAADCRDRPRGCTGAETYLRANLETRVVEEHREGLSVAWFASSGSFADERTGRSEVDPDVADSTNLWTAPDLPGLVRLWIVLRDDRGGVGWGEYMVEVD